MKTVSGMIKAGVLGALVSGFISVAANAGDVEIVFSERLEKRMNAISRIDKKREEIFRGFRRDGARVAQRPSDVVNRTRFANTEWGNERLFPSIDDYSVPALFQAMMERGVAEAAGADFDGRVVLEVEKMFVSRFPHASLRSFNTRMRGIVKLYDASGNKVAEHKVWTALVPAFYDGFDYQGPDYAYRATAGNTRVGPIAAEFTAKALTKLFPDYDAPGAIFLSGTDDITTF